MNKIDKLLQLMKQVNELHPKNQRNQRNVRITLYADGSGNFTRGNDDLCDFNSVEHAIELLETTVEDELTDFKKTVQNILRHTPIKKLHKIIDNVFQKTNICTGDTVELCSGTYYHAKPGSVGYVMDINSGTARITWDDYIGNYRVKLTDLCKHTIL